MGKIYESSEAVPHHLTVASHSRRAARLLRRGVACTDARPSTCRPRDLGQQRRYRELVVRALLVAHRVCACLEMRTVGGSATARRQSVPRTQKSPTEVRWAAVVTVLPSAICQLPAAARSSRSSNKRALPPGTAPVFVKVAGVDKLKIEMMYVLADGTGEVFWPKEGWCVDGDGLYHCKRRDL